MADASTTPTTGLEPLLARLSDPEPLCLGIVEVVVPPAQDGRHDAGAPLLALAAARLRETLRPYDELELLPDGRFVIILPTLADRTTLAHRMNQVFLALDAPYPIGADTVGVRVLLGAAVRSPQDDARAFLARVAGAVLQAEREGGQGPVLV